MRDPQRRKAEGVPTPPPDEEFERRIGRLRTALDDSGADGAVIYGAGPDPDPIRYLTGYVHVFARARSLLILPRRGDPILLLDREWHRPEAERMTWIDDVRALPWPEAGADQAALRARLGEAFADAGLEGGTVAVPDLEFPAALLGALEGAEGAPTVSVLGSLWPGLVTDPTPYDAARIEETAAIADAGLKAFVSACRPGVSERAACFAALEAMAEAGAEFLHGSAVSTHVDVGSFSRGRSNLQPYLHTESELEAGELFWVDLIACHDGYYVDCDRTVCVGEPSAEQRALYEVCREMYDAMLEAIAPGVTGATVWRAGREVAERAGHGDRLNAIYLGHSTGITISSSPVVRADETAELRAGQFLNVEPGIFHPEIGAACIENTVRVAEGGVEPINGASIDLRVV